MQIPAIYDYNPLDLIRLIKSKGFTLRLSIAMTNWFDDYFLDEILSMLKDEWNPDQVSFKKLFGAEDLASKKYDEFAQEFRENPQNKKLEFLPLGVWKYDAGDIAIVWNDDCMVSIDQKNPRYFILQPNGKLYTRWNSKASLIF